MDVGSRHYNFTNYFTVADKQHLYRSNYRNLLSGENVFTNLVASKNFIELDQVFYLDFSSYLPDDLNVKVDLASMKNALEVRSPFLDYELVNLTAALPVSYKLNHWSGKLLLKKMLQPVLPTEVLTRKKKGFSLPLAAWLRGELRDYAMERIQDPASLARRLFEERELTRLISEHQTGRDRAKKIWALLVLNLWYDKYFT